MDDFCYEQKLLLYNSLCHPNQALSLFWDLRYSTHKRYIL
jgi:hypothetical protein